ncbi:hypothetical protein LCGC14_1318300 [marine sediment metagenome]|uniref:Uncharacterized protein n=1 Tax=marine sediment metagenome TaxID=412755 RepID=A0A0F9KKT7_9ZZZZ
MNLGQWIAAKFGAQYVMLRCGHQLTFRIKRAYRIGGRWYTHTYHNKDRDCPSDSGSVIPKGHAYYMLTDTTRLTKAKGLDPGTMVMSHELWIPLTEEVDAGVRMYE